ncbi:BTAD domain-containing putative transcriptional regulator [Dactylosporangium sp. CA-052675]|uniref:AfsR/SARP family transcriptional regulator n=1 Tax=Dactylosporangium sp. CA-052675 TaxID=3239927 RepID=UPI003D93E37A
MEFRLLGPVDVRSATGEPVVLGTPMRVHLLALLLTEPGVLFPAERLVDELWPVGPPRSVANNLKTYVWSLRKALRTSPQAPPVIENRAGGYRIVVDKRQVDTELFAELSRGGFAALRRHDRVVALDAFERALALWRGRPFLGLPATGTLHAVGVALHEQRLALVEEVADLYLAAGRHHEVIEWLRAHVLAEPLRERPWAQLMTALVRAGRQVDALSAYRQLHRQLAEEAGVEPGPEIQALHRRILRGDDAAGRATWTAQIMVSPAGRNEPLAPVVGLVPRQLPADVSAFVGRDAELGRLDRLVDGQATAIGVISGMAGLGKTALAVHWAHRNGHRFPDGQIFLNLRGYGPGQALSSLQALTHLLVAVGVEPQRVPADEQHAAALLRSVAADKRVLLVLDNARSAEQVRPLLLGGASAAVIVTSRQRLDGLIAHNAARDVDLCELGSSHAVELLGQVLGTRMVLDEPDATGELVRLCGALPLALRIAAAAVNRRSGKPIAEYVDHLHSSGPLAGLGVPDDPQYGIEAAFGYSYAALDAGSQQLFRWLGLLPVPDVSTATVAAALGSSVVEAAARLSRLAQAHLVDLADGRTSMHDLLREYAASLVRQQDSPAERSATLRRVYVSYLCRAEAAARALYPQLVRLPFDDVCDPGLVDECAFDTPADAARWLAAEQHNFVVVAESALRDGHPDVAWLLSATLRGHFMSNRDVPSWLRVASTALAGAQEQAAPAGMAAAQLSLALMANCTGNNLVAIKHCEASVRLAGQAGWAQGRAAAVNALGVMHSYLGHTARAVQYLEQSIGLRRASGNEATVGAALNNLGMIHTLCGDLDLADAKLREALALHTTREHRRGAASVLLNIGQVQHHRGKHGDAWESMHRAREIYRELRDVEGEATALGYLADVAHARGQTTEAITLARAALRALRATDDLLTEGIVLIALAAIRRDLGHDTVAMLLFERALRLATDAHCRQNAIAAMLGIADLWQRRGSADRAEHYALLASDMSRLSGYRTFQASALRVLALVRSRAGARDDALRMIDESVRIHQETRFRRDLAQALDTRSVILATCRPSGGTEISEG